MRRHRGRWLGLCIGLLLCAPAAQAQVAALGKGWLLDAAGSITSLPSEVVSGRGSIKGSYSGPSTHTAFLQTDPLFVRFAPNQTCVVTLRYRILVPASGSFDFAINSPTANNAGLFGPGASIKGAAGATGTATLTGTLLNYPDYHLSVGVAGTGAIVIDDIRITTLDGQLVASEDAEGPPLAPGPLSFQLTDAMSLLAEAGGILRSAALRDLDADGRPEVILTLTAPRPSNTPIQPIVIAANGPMRVATADFFPAGAPTVKHSPVTVFADVNNDGLEDVLFADAGSDAPPWTGSRIGVALNLGGGKYRDVSSLVPADQQTTRSYALAAGDLDGDGRAEIVLPDQGDGSRTALLRWNGNGFDEQRGWIASSLWQSPTNLAQQSWMVIADFDKDGRQDLLVAGQGAPPTPNLRVLFGSAGGLTSAGLVQLPDGIWGHAPFNLPVSQGADIGPVLVADFDNDGLPDIFAFEEQVTTYQPGLFTDTQDPAYDSVRANGGTVYGDIAFQMLINQGARRFVDVSAASSVRNLGRRYYNGAVAVDINNDGFLDIVGVYQTKNYAGIHRVWGTTFLLNDGTGAFQVVDGADLLGTTTAPPGAQRWNLGAFLPTLATPRRLEGIAFESVGGCEVGCLASRLNLYKVVADGALGTGPNFVDAAALGVPGFNEFYYLRHYTDAAAAVQAGQYATGLAHYLAVGKAKGYLPSAAAGVPLNLAANTAGSAVTLTWSAPLAGAPSSYVLEAGSAAGLSDIASAPTGTTATLFSKAGITAGTYYVRMRAIHGSTTSGPSNEVVVTVGPSPSCTAAPSAPSGFTALVVGPVVTLRWTASPGSSARSYVLDAGSAPGLTDVITVDMGNTTKFTAPHVAAGTYYGRIKAVNACGTSAPSNEAIVTVDSAAAPRARRASAAAPGKPSR